MVRVSRIRFLTLTATCAATAVGCAPLQTSPEPANPAAAASVRMPREGAKKPERQPAKDIAERNETDAADGPAPDLLSALATEATEQPKRLEAMTAARAAAALD